MKKNLLALVIGIFAAMIVLEVYLRLFYPFPSLLRRGEVFLPVNTSKIIKLNTPGLSDEVIFSRNSVGLRGEEPPADLSDRLSIITVGGSTTESHYQSDDRTWTALLGEKLKQDFPAVWVNNAGRDGLSTFGIMILMDEHVVKLKPKIVIYSIGANDVAVAGLEKFDALLFSDYESSGQVLRKKRNQSAIFTLVKNLRLAQLAKNSGLTHDLSGFLNEERFNITPEQRAAAVRRAETTVPQFKNRVRWLVRNAQANGIDPVLVTEPSLLGDLIDPTSGVDLAAVKYRGVTGAVYWEQLQLYHQATREVGEEMGVYVIDMGAKMPKDSLYFYDAHHYTDKGAEKFAKLLYGDLLPYLKQRYSYLKK